VVFDVYLSFRTRGALGHQGEDGAGILVSQAFGRVARIFAVVGHLASNAQVGQGISVNNGGTTFKKKNKETVILVR